MGCGSSTGNSASLNNQADDVLDLFGFCEIYVASSEPNYPAPRPPPTRKNECFNAHQMSGIDAKAKKAPDSYADSFETLLWYLTEDCKTEVEKLRSIFSWLGAQVISKAIYRSAEADTPKGFLNLLRLKKNSYESFFAKLCRAAGLPCVIVLGLGKSSAYEVGDTNLERLRNHWNAVYVDGAWRIVDPAWAFTGLIDHNTGTWALLETEGKQINERQSAAEGVVVQQVNEFHFMTDPDHHICTSFPDNPKWQLMSKPWTLKQFETVPFFHDDYFLRGFQLLSTYNCRLASKGGICEIEFRVPKSLISSGIMLTYSLYGDDNVLATILANGIPLANYVFSNKIDNRFRFEVRLPFTGKYKMVIEDICEFLIECGPTQTNCKHLPILPEIGWGPTRETQELGFEATTHTSGSVYVKKNETAKIRFNNSKGLEIRSELKNRTIAQALLQSCVAQKVNDDEVEFIVTIPEDDEFALQLFAKSENSTDGFKNFCNYLLRPADDHKRNNMREDVQARHFREVLKMQMEQGNIAKLEQIINLFEEHNIDDKGDLASAKYQLQFLILQKDVQPLGSNQESPVDKKRPPMPVLDNSYCALRDATMSRKIGTLEKAINDANRSSHKPRLEIWITKAKIEIEALKKFIRLRHAILEMKQATIAEIRSYQRPPLAVKHVMMATFTILGANEKLIQNWEYVQSLIGSLKRQVQTFDITNASVMTAAAARKYTNVYDIDSVREVSCGAATFYVWTENIIKEIQNRADR